jgi:hypothetical protein
MASDYYDYEQYEGVFKIFKGSVVIAVCNDVEDATKVIEALNHECEEQVIDPYDDEIIKRLFDL